MYKIAVFMSSELCMSAPTDTQTLTFRNLLLLMEGAQVSFVLSPLSSQEEKPLYEAVHTVCTVYSSSGKDRMHQAIWQLH